MSDEQQTGAGNDEAGLIAAAVAAGWDDSPADGADPAADAPAGAPDAEQVEPAEAAADGEQEPATGESEQDAAAEPEPDPPEGEPWSLARVDQAIADLESGKVEPAEAAALARRVLESAHAVTARANRAHASARKRGDKLAAKVAELKKDRELVTAERDRMQSVVTRLKQGDAKARLAAMGELFGRPGAEVWEDLTLAVATDGADGLSDGKPESGAIADLRKELAEMRELLTQKDVQSQEAAQRAQAEAAVRFVGQTISDAARFPLLSEEDPGDVSDHLQILWEGLQQAEPGRHFAIPELCDRLEANLREQLTRRAARLGLTGDAAGAETPKRRARSSPAKTPMAPSAADASSGRKRPLTEAEIIASAAELVPEEWLGGR